MNDQAITFDFHNTLVACPEWFELEVRELPTAFLNWWSAERNIHLAPEATDDASARYRQLRREIIEHGNELTAEACLTRVFKNMGLAVSQEDITAGVRVLMLRALSGASPIPGAVKTVRALARLGIPIGVVSSAVYHPALEWALAEFGMLEAMRTVITSASAGFYKSRRELYLHAAQQLGSSPARMVHVGDSLRFDVGGAQRVGMGTVWLQHDTEAPGDDAIVPDLILRSLHDAAPPIQDLLDRRLNHSTAVTDARV